MDDVEAFWALRLRALREHPGAFASAFEESSGRPLDAVRQDFEMRNTGPESIVIGAFDGEALVGTIGCFRQQGAKLRHKAVIWTVYVAPEARGRGVGRALVDAAVATARSWEGVEQVHLSVASDNAQACRLYRAAGFAAYGVEPRALKLRDRYVDEDHMVLRLT